MSSRSGTSTQPLRSLNMNYGSQQQPQQQPSASRQTPRLQNTQKSAIGNGWGSFGMPSSGGGGGGGGGAFGGLGAAPGLGGPGRPGHLSGFAQVIGGGSGQGPIDMSDFPSLSGGPRAQSNNANAASWNSSAIRQPSSQQQQPQSHQPQQRAPSAAPSQQSLDHYDGQRSQLAPGERTGSGDDFPPLGGPVNGDSMGQSNGFNSGFGSPDIPQSRTNGQQSQLPIRQASDGFSQNQQAPIGQPSAQQQSQPSQSGPSPSTSGIKRYADMTEHEKWGLPGLMAAFEARKQAENGGPVDDSLPPAMRSAVMMGHDLNSLGLDLDSPEPMYPTFTPFQAVGRSNTSFDFHDRHTVPDFTLPSAYTVTNVPPLAQRMASFSEETLFAIFYQNPKDFLQEQAAHELMVKDWRWHKVLRQWLQKDTREASNNTSSPPLVDLTNGAPYGAPPIRKSERVEQGVYIFFDANNWRRERRYLDLDYEQLDPPRGIPGPLNGAGGPSLGGAGGGGGGPGRLLTEVGQQSGVGSSQIPSA